MSQITTAIAPRPHVPIGPVTYFVAALVESRRGFAPERWRTHKCFDDHAEALAWARKRAATTSQSQEVYAVDALREPWAIISYEVR